MDAALPAQHLSPFPTVDLRRIAVPTAGLQMGVPDECSRNFRKNGDCIAHYQRLATEAIGAMIQCPYGFASLSFQSVNVTLALTGFIPYPRLGGEAERRVSKKYPSHRAANEAVSRAASVLDSLARDLKRMEGGALKKQSVALHELRKLNRSMKQTAERLCRERSPKDPEAAPADLVRLWKTADLISHQFDVIEFLANEELAALPLNSTVEIYKLFDRCVRVYRPAGEARRLTISAPGFYAPRIAACEKTLPIIPTALIENALRYSIKDTEVSVTLRKAGERCVVEVNNWSVPNRDLDERVFTQGVRVSPDSEGSGNGLYLAQLVAQQHGTLIQLAVTPAGRDRVRCTFSLAFKVVK